MNPFLRRSLQRRGLVAVGSRAAEVGTACFRHHAAVQGCSVHGHLVQSVGENCKRERKRYLGLFTYSLFIIFYENVPLELLTLFVTIYKEMGHFYCTLPYSH